MVHDPAAGACSASLQTAKLRRRFVQLAEPSGSAGGRGLRLLQWNLLADGLSQYGGFVAVRAELVLGSGFSVNPELYETLPCALPGTIAIAAMLCLVRGDVAELVVTCFGRGHH